MPNKQRVIFTIDGLITKRYKNCVPQVKNNLFVDQVDLKMRYNDARRTKIGQQDILSGKEWYEIQAFRALNQVDIDYFMLTRTQWRSQGLKWASCSKYRRIYAAICNSSTR